MNIKEVARLARVSTATVSRVLNDPSVVRPTTCEHVKRVIEKLSYVPNVSARNLRTGRSRLFGLIVSDIKNPFFPDLIDAFDAMATKHGIDVVFSHTNYDGGRLGHCLRRMVERNVDGIAVMTSEVSAEALERVNWAGVPLVLLNQAALDKKYNNIGVDYSVGFEEAIQHLRNLGHRHIAFIAGPKAFSSSERRREAFLAGIKRCGLKVRKEWIFVGDLHVEGGYVAMERLIQSSPRPTAVISTNDLMAVGALQAAQAAGLLVPRDISIIGFDDIPICTIMSPALSTITLPRQEIAERAFSILLRASRPGRTSRISSHSISPRLTIRGSTAPPA